MMTEISQIPRSLYRAEEEIEMPTSHRYSACLYFNRQLIFHQSGNDSLTLTVNLFCKLEEAPVETYGVLFDHKENKALRHCQKSPSTLLGTKNAAVA